MDWFRFYTRALDNAKIQKLSPTLFKDWVNVMCIAAENEKDGELPDIDRYCFRVRISKAKAMRKLKSLVDSGLIDRVGDHFQVHDWKDWQYNSDTSTERVRKHRAKKRQEHPGNVSVERSRNAIEQNRTEQNRTEGARETFRFEEFWERYPNKVGRDKAYRMWLSVITAANVAEVFAGLERWEKSERWNRKIYHDPVNWLNEKLWEDSPPAEEAGQSSSAGVPEWQSPPYPVRHLAALARDPELANQQNNESPRARAAVIAHARENWDELSPELQATVKRAYSELEDV